MILAFVTPVIFSSLFAYLNSIPVCIASNTSAEALTAIDTVIALGVDVTSYNINLCCGLYMRPASSMNTQSSKIQFVSVVRDIFLLPHLDVRPVRYQKFVPMFVKTTGLQTKVL